jgi:hypothetical protein
MRCRVVDLHREDCFYGLVSVALSASFFVGYFQAVGAFEFWATFSIQTALLVSCIPFRNIVIKQLSITSTGLILLNLFSPLFQFVEDG